MQARALTRSFSASSPILGIAWAALRPLLGLIARSPLATTTLTLLTLGYVWAAINALYLQDPPALPRQFPSAQSQDAIARALAAIPALEPDTPPVRPVTLDTAPTQSVTRSATPVPVPGQVVGNPESFRIQSMLKALGFFPAEIDGYYGPVTAAAIRAFEARAGLVSTGAMGTETVRAIEDAYLRGAVSRSLAISPPEAIAEPIAKPITEPVQQVASRDPLAEIARTAAATAPDAQQMAAAFGSDDAERALVLSVQKGLASLGFLHGPVDGIAGEATAKAIRNFEVFHNYRVTGEVTPELIDMLQAANASF